MAKKVKTLTYEELKAQKLNLNQELFCQLYVKGGEIKGNGTQCYVQAFGIDIDSMSAEQETRIEIKGGEEVEIRIPGTSERERALSVATELASRLLRKVCIQERVNAIFQTLLNDNVVDGQLAKIVLQEGDLHASLGGIKEYNKLKKRVTDLIELKRPLEDMTDEELAAVQKEARNILMKK